jgi:hypothetical protein
MSAAPILIQSLDATGIEYWVRSNGQENDNSAKNYRRTWKVGSFLYALGWDPSGDNVDGGSPYYFRQTWTMSRSSNSGATWTQLDNDNRPIGVISFGRGGTSEAAVLVDTKIWVFYDYGEHPDTAGVYGYQFDEIRVIAFDTATNTWGTPITTGGPKRELTDTAFSKSNLATDAAYRGSDEVIVFHRDTDETQTYRRSLYSVFNLSSGTWTSTDNVVFTSANANIDPAHCIYDGTYTHFFTYGGPYTTASGEKWHRTLTGSTLGTVTDLFAAWPGGWRSLATDYQSYYGQPIVYGSEVIFVMQSRLLTVSSSLQYRIITFRAPTATAVPSWTIDDIGSTAWDALYADWGHSGTPALVENSGDLYVIHGGYGIYTFGPTVRRFSLYSQKYLGAGSWDTPVKLWDQFDATGYAGSSEQDIFKFSPVAGLGGSTLDQQIGIVTSTITYSSGQDSIYWIRTPVSCCCANYAY